MDSLDDAENCVDSLDDAENCVDSLDDAENCVDSLDDAENSGFRSHEIASGPKMRGNGGTIGNGRIA